jgi:GTPase
MGVVAICKIERCHSIVLPELRILLIGDTDSGKTTLVSSITHFKKDSGDGKTRMDSMRHTHEMKSGKTSSISTNLYGYTEKNEVIGYGNISYRSWNIISKKSKKIVTIIDTPGKNKYVKTSLHCLFSSYPNVVFYFLDTKKCFFEKNVKKFLENINKIN